MRTQAGINTRGPSAARQAATGLEYVPFHIGAACMDDEGDHNRETMPPQQGPAEQSKVQYRVIDPARFAAKISQDAASMREVLKAYESAREVPQSLLEVEICV